MGTFKSNLAKISQHWGVETTIVLLAKIFAIQLLLVANLHSTRAKSIVLLPSLLNYNEASQETTESDPTTPEITHDPIVLDMIMDPEAEWEMWSNATTHTFVLGEYESNQGWKMAVHLKDCDFDTGDSIQLIDDRGKRFEWFCPKKTIKYGFYTFLKEYAYISNDGRGSYSRDKFVNAIEVMENLRNVTITPNLHHNSGVQESIMKATVIVSIYKDVYGSDNCPENLFDCRQTICTCCAEPEPSSTSRCIPLSLRCKSVTLKPSTPKRNENPNCGMIHNIDETNEICHPEKACQCQTVCLAWNYVLTSLAIAILFIITPTAIVFALFHRRNVALERARLIRLAQMRMAELRGGFTREDPLNDRPPSYDEVYDIKEPPPCFCQALAMQREHDLLEHQGKADISSNESIQNLGFQCSCADIRKDDTEHQDIPPSYSEVSTRRNDDNNESARNKDHPSIEQNFSQEEPDSTQAENLRNHED